MRFQNYNDLTETIKLRAKRISFAVVCANEMHTIEAVMQSYDDGFALPYFIGASAEIKCMLDSYGYNPAQFEIQDESDPDRATRIAVEMVHGNTVQGIIKGRIETGQLMRILLKSESKLRVSSVVCAMSLMEIPNYHKLIAASDPAICINPSLDEKRAIIDNAVSALINMGIDEPKVAILAPAETVNPKIQETVDAQELKRLNELGDIKNCIIDGPLSYDLCMDSEAAKIKNLDSRVAGDTDLIIYPNLSTGNAVSKALVHSAGAVGSSVILGTSVPIVLPSRSASTAEKARNVLLAAASASEEYRSRRKIRR